MLLIGAGIKYGLTETEFAEVLHRRESDSVVVTAAPMLKCWDENRTRNATFTALGSWRVLYDKYGSGGFPERVLILGVII